MYDWGSYLGEAKKLEYLEAEKLKLERSASRDIVRGSYTEFPWTSHCITVEGFADAELTKEEIRLRAMIAEQKHKAERAAVRLWQEIRKHKAEEQKVLALTFGHGLTRRQVADQLCMSAAKVNRIIKRITNPKESKV